jgi:hypothetical protein
MIGIVGILLLGSLAWSAVGALFAAMGDAAAAITSSATPAPKLGLGGLGTPSPQPAGAVTVVATRTSAQAAPQPDTPGLTPTPGTSSAAPTPAASSALTPRAEPSSAAKPTPEPSTAHTPTPAASGRAPWILLPGPAPGARVPTGSQVIEARGRGDSIIRTIRLELDGAALDVSLEQRSDSVWRGSSTANVAAGQHAVRAVVVDDQGRTGSFRWTFEAGP